MAQASFPFPPHRKTFDELDITASNEAAIRAIRRHEQWPTPILCLVGPPRSGLTTIAQAWASDLGGTYICTKAFNALNLADIDSLAARTMVIDNANLVEKESEFLTLLNRVNEMGGKLLLTSNMAPPFWHMRSADLVSRLKSIPVTEITEPDEAALQARLKATAKLHFLRLDDDVLSYVALRLGRDYAAVNAFVSLLSEAVTQAGRAPSVHLAREVLEEMAAGGQDGE